MATARGPNGASGVAGVADSLTQRLSWVFLRAAFRAAMRNVDVQAEGLEHLPKSGPAIIAARHFHHFYDGAALLTLAKRPLRVVVTLDWVENPLGRAGMTLACRAAGWPVTPRRAAAAVETGRPKSHTAQRWELRAAARESVALLRAGRMLLLFPEGYPTIDPGYTPKTRDDEILPFQPGFLRFAALAERDGRTHVPIIPAGLEYRRGERWGLTIRFGSAVSLSTAGRWDEQAAEIEQQVRQLSGLAPRQEARG